MQSKVDWLSHFPLSGAIIDAVLNCYRYSQGNHRISGAHKVLPAQWLNCVAYIDCNIAGDLSLPQLLAH